MVVQDVAVIATLRRLRRWGDHDSVHAGSMPAVAGRRLRETVENGPDCLPVTYGRRPSKCRAFTVTPTCKENLVGSGGEVGEVDAVSEVVELADELVASFASVGVAGEVVAAEVVVVGVVGE